MILNWKRTYPDKPDDFEGRDPTPPLFFARICLTHSHTTETPWYWTCSLEGVIGNGYEALAKAAASAAEAAYVRWRGRDSPREE